MSETVFNPELQRLMLALGAGLLVGAERERRKLADGRAEGAGIRTFALASLAGAVAFLVGGMSLLAVAVVLASAIAALAGWRGGQPEDGGFTTEIALVLTVLVGGLAMREPAAAAGVAVATAFLLAARKGAHHFVGRVLTEEEMRAALILAVCAVVVLPLLPNTPLGPFGALNPFKIWRLVVVVLAIGAVGHLAVRVMGPKAGLPVAGLASGFVSSSATIGAMGGRAKKSPEMRTAATAGAVLSTVATVAQLAAVVGMTSPATLLEISGMLILAGVAACAYGAIYTLRALRQPSGGAIDPGQPFKLSAALIFAAVLTTVLLVSAALSAWLGKAGAIAAAAAAGFVDTHAAAISIASLAASGHLQPSEAVWPILAGFTTNTISKMVIAVTSGGRDYASRVIPGLLIVALAAWIGVFIRPF